jgi:hypothetical protein
MKHSDVEENIFNEEINNIANEKSFLRRKRQIKLLLEKAIGKGILIGEKNRAELDKNTYNMSIEKLKNEMCVINNSIKDTSKISNKNIEDNLKDIQTKNQIIIHNLKNNHEKEIKTIENEKNKIIIRIKEEFKQEINQSEKNWKKKLDIERKRVTDKLLEVERMQNLLKSDFQKKEKELHNRYEKLIEDAAMLKHRWEDQMDKMLEFLKRVDATVDVVGRRVTIVRDQGNLLTTKDKYKVEELQFECKELIKKVEKDGPKRNKKKLSSKMLDFTSTETTIDSTEAKYE